MYASLDFGLHSILANSAEISIDNLERKIGISAFSFQLASGLFSHSSTFVSPRQLIIFDGFRLPTNWRTFISSAASISIIFAVGVIVDLKKVPYASELLENDLKTLDPSRPEAPKINTGPVLRVAGPLLSFIWL